MNKNLFFVFIAASFALLVFSPGRLCYGIILILEFNVICVAGSAALILIKKFCLDNLQDVLLLSCIISCVILFKQILILFSPVIALNLGFLMFAPAVSVFLLGNVFSKNQPKPLEILRQTSFFSAFSLFFFFLRELLGYGTLSLPAYNSILEFYLFDSRKTSFLLFFATIPGALLLEVFCMALILFFQRKMNIVQRVGGADGND